MEVTLDRIEKLLKEILRREDSQDKQLQLIYKDREILLDIQDTLTGGRQRQINDRNHNEELIKDVKAEIGDVKATLEDNTVLVKSPRQSVIDKLFMKMRGGDKKK